ncbi:hypothetical protein ACFWVB_02675 [Streptomyces microflavus]|uniref:hypothetical protein n=1 Tax=Streptomyces microflavus TaxID=1919 RepID=UPI003669935B
MKNPAPTLPEDDTTATGPACSEYPIPDVPVVMEVTRAMAADWLDHRNVAGNRTQSNVTARKYARLMQAGKFKTTHQGIAFDRAGFLIDGQHRLVALTQTGLSLKLFVIPYVEGMDERTFDVLDLGLRRNAAQFIKTPYGGSAASAAKFLGVADGSFGLDTDSHVVLDVHASRVEMNEILDVVAAWPELRTWAKDAKTVSANTLIPPGPHLAVLAQAERTDYRDRIPEWIEGLMHGVGLTAQDSRLHLRNRFIREGRSLNGSTAGRATAYRLIVRAWNAHATGTPMGVLRFSDKEDAPVVIGLDLDDE